MWPVGHVAIAYLLYTASTRLRFDDRPTAVAAILVGFGSLFPDLVDKPLAWYLGVLPTGRTLAHSLLFLVPFVLLVYTVARWRGQAEYGFAFGLGAVSHSLVDAIPALWMGASDASVLLWPLLSQPTYEGGSPTVLGLLRDSMTDPYFLSEFVFLAIALIVWRADGYPGLEFVPGIDAPEPDLGDQAGRDD